MNTSHSNVYSDIKFGISNNGERYFWAAYHFFVLLSSLIGDTLILIASFQKDAFKVSKILVTIIQHIAVSDLVFAISTVLPATISLLANSWVLGGTICYVQVYLISYYVYLSGMSLIAILTTSKFLILRYPLRAATWSTNRVHLICSLVWTISVINPILFFTVDKHDVFFDYRNYYCEYGFTDKIWRKILIPITGCIFGLVPNAIIIATTIPTLKYLVDATKVAKRVQGTVPWQGAVTVAATAVVYCISTLPHIIYKICWGLGFIKEGNPGGWSHIQYYRVSSFLLLVDIMSNFYIYTLTIKSFRKFLLTKVLCFVPASLSSVRDMCLSSTGNI